MLTCATRPIKKLIGLHPWILASLLVCLVPGTVMAGQLYAVQHGSSQIHTIDLTTGEATLVNPVPLTDLAGIAFDALGTLYAITDSPNEAVLYTIDPDDGTAALVGLTATPAFEGGLTFDPSSGVLYGKGGVDGFDAGLIIFDSTTGLGGLVGSMGLAVEADISGMDFMADGTLLAYDPQGELNSRILSIDPLSGAASVIGNTGFFTTSTYGGLAVDPDTDLVYASDGTGLFLINPLTGAGTMIGLHGTPEPVSGLSFRPNPVCMIGIGIGNDGINLWDVDPDTGDVTNPRPLGPAPFYGMAQAPSGELFGLRESTLYQIDQATGAITPAGPGPSGVTVIEGGLDFHPTTGVLYGVNGAPTGGGLPGLFTIDTTTGVANVIAPILDFDDAIIDASALAFDDSGILYILRTSNLTGPPELWILDPSDASTLSVVPLVGFSGSIDVAGMDFDDSTGILWVVLRSVNALLKVDPMTGASTSIPMTLDVVNSSLEVIAPCGEGGGPTAFPVPVLPAAGIAFLLAGLIAMGCWATARKTRVGYRRLR